MVEFPFIAGAPWLDFVNTIVMVRGQRVDLLPDGERLSAWLEAEAAHSGDASRRIGPPGDHFYSAAVELREVLRELAGAAASGSAADAIVAVLPGLNAHLSRMPLRLQLAQVESGIREHAEIEGPEAPLFPVVRSVLDHLAGHNRVRRCDHPDCILYFLETPRNRGRRWCSMATCGNRMKAARHHRGGGQVH